jgi:hypothetical protein
MYPLHDRVVRFALAEYQHGVREDPPGSNTGPRVREYQAATWLGGTGWPWCCAFAVWCWQKALGRPLPYRGAGAYAWLDWARKAGWVVDAQHAIPGDFVVFNIGAGHMAILREPVTRGEVLTVDGNVSDAVGLRSRTLSTVRGFVHIPEQPVAVEARPPMFEVITSETGYKVIYVSGANAVAKRLPGFLRRHPVLTIRRRR